MTDLIIRLLHYTLLENEEESIIDFYVSIRVIYIYLNRFVFSIKIS